MIAFFTVLYNPESNALVNIRNAKLAGLSVVVYLNAVDSHFREILEAEEIQVLGNGVNDGLGVAFKAAEEYMIVSNLEFYVYFDQDTIVDRECWNTIAKEYKYYFSESMIGLVYLLPSTKLFPKLVINSGCIFSMRAIRKIGLHESAFFVEGVDYEFCLRLANKGYKIISFPLFGLDHNKLQEGRIIYLLGVGFHVRVYGKRRTTDFNIAHIKLLKKSLSLFRFEFFCIFLRSLIAFNVREVISRIALVWYR